MNYEIFVYFVIVENSKLDIFALNEMNKNILLTH